MPVRKCSNGKWRIGSGQCMYTSKESAERAYKGYLGSKYAEEQEMKNSKLQERKLVHAVEENGESEKPQAADVARMMKLAGINKKLEDDQEEGRVDFNGVFTGVAKGDIDVKESRFGLMNEFNQMRSGDPRPSGHETDHEISLAQSQLHRAEEYAGKLHNMLDHVPETHGLQAWMQMKITQASDAIAAVYHRLEHEMGHDLANGLPQPNMADGSYVDGNGNIMSADDLQMAREHAELDRFYALTEEPHIITAEKSYNRALIEVIVDEIRAGKTPAQISEDLAYEESDIQKIYDMMMEKATKRTNISQLPESRDGYCSDKCCGSDVPAKDCGCPPTCPHCDCNAVNESKKPDFLDFDGDGDTDEPMTKALKDKEKMKEMTAKDDATKHNVDPGEMVRVTNFKAKTPRYKVLDIKGDKVTLEKPDGSSMVMPLDRIKKVKAMAHKYQQSMTEGANVEALKSEYRDLEQEYNAILAGMSDADENEVQDRAEAIADQLYRMGVDVHADNMNENMDLTDPDDETYQGIVDTLKAELNYGEQPDDLANWLVDTYPQHFDFKEASKMVDQVMDDLRSAQDERGDYMMHKRQDDMMDSDNQLTRMAKLAGVQYSAPHPVTEADLNEDSALSSLGVPKPIISKIHQLTRVAHDVDMIPAKNKADLKAGLDNQGFVVVVGNGEYGVAAYSRGYGRGANVYYDARKYDAEGNVVAKERGALTKVLGILPKGKYYVFNPERDKGGWGNKWRGEKNPYSSEVSWASSDEMVQKVADRVEERAHEALKARVLEIRDQLAQQLEPGDSGIDLGDNYENLTKVMKHAASLYKKPEQFRSHLENTVKRYLLKYEAGTDDVDDYKVNPDNWSKMNYGRAPKDLVSRRIDMSREGNKYKSQGQLINRISRAVIDFYRNLGDKYSDNQVASKFGSVN